MPDTLIKVDLSQSAYENDMIHNRWHPDIPMVATVKPGQDFIIECYDWTGGFIKNDEFAADVRDIDLSIVHFLSGPVGVEVPNPATSSSWTSSISAPSRTTPGASTDSSRRRTAAASSPITSRRRRNPSGISTACSPRHATCRASASPA